MQKLTLLSVLAILCLKYKAYAQNIEIVPFYVGERVPDLPLPRIINFKDSTPTLSSFGDKLVVLSFWSIYCKSCIELFHFEDSLQRVHNDKLQIVLVTMDSKEKVLPFLKRYNNSRQTKLSLPVMYGDSVLVHLFRHRSVPHYAWIAPNGNLLAQTGSEYMNVSTLEHMAKKVFQQQQKLRQYNISEVMLRYPKVPDPLLQVIEKNKLDENE